MADSSRYGVIEINDDGNVLSIEENLRIPNLTLP